MAWIRRLAWYGQVANQDREYRAFQEAREFVRSLVLKNVTRSDTTQTIFKSDDSDDPPRLVIN